MNRAADDLRGHRGDERLLPGNSRSSIAPHDKRRVPDRRSAHWLGLPGLREHSAAFFIENLLAVHGTRPR